MVDLFMAMKSVMAMQEKEMKLLTSNQPMVQGKNLGLVWFGPHLGPARIVKLFRFWFMIKIQMKPNYLLRFARHLVMKMRKSLSWFGFMVEGGNLVLLNHTMELL